MYDVLLVSPPSRMVNHYRPPLSLIHIGGYLTHKGLKVKIVDKPMKQVIRNKEFWKSKNTYLSEIRKEMLTDVRENPSDFVGVSCYSTEFDEVKELIRDIRGISKAKIIVGGVHPTLVPQDFNRISDYIVRGYGEMASYGIITNQQMSTKNFDDFCYPNYDLVDMDYYTTANPYAIRGVFLRATYLLAGFGCPSSCTFCVAKSLRPFFGVGNLRSPQRIIQDLNYLKDRYHIDGFYFIDDLFTIKKPYVLEFCKQVKNTKLLWGCSSKVTTLDEEMISSMAESGCIQMDFGVERGSNEELQKLKKGQTIEKVKEIFNLCSSYKIRTFANFIVGLPEESPKDREDIELLVREISPTIISFNLFESYCGTELKGKTEYSLIEWIKKKTKEHNSLWRNFRCYLSRKYWKNILFSKKKMNYLKQLWTLIQEVINQKFQ